MGQNEVNGLIGEQIPVPPGATLAIVIGATAGEGSSILKYFSGGTVQIFNCPPGSTLTAAQLVSYGNSGGYVLGTAEAINIEGPVRYYLMASGTTAVVMHIRGLTSGF